MKSLMIILLSAMLTDNFVLAKFMGICPFLGVSKKLDSASGMGLAVTFVMICATIVTYPIHHGILVPNGLEYFDTVVFILVIALFVQLVETMLKKCVPSLYSSLGVYLPLITTNCAVLGVTVLNIDNSYSFLLILERVNSIEISACSSFSLSSENAFNSIKTAVCSSGSLLRRSSDKSSTTSLMLS